MNKLAIIGVLCSGLFIGCGGDDATKVVPLAPDVAVTSPSSAAPTITDEGGAAATASNSDCEGLGEYSVFVDDYIKLLEDGDMSMAMTLMSKADSAGEGLAKMEPTSDCFREYMAINKKMTDAAMRMSGASAADMKEVDDLNKEAEKAIDALGCIETCQKKSDPMEQMTCLQAC